MAVNTTWTRITDIVFSRSDVIAFSTTAFIVAVAYVGPATIPNAPPVETIQTRESTTSGHGIFFHINRALEKPSQGNRTALATIR